MAKGSKNNGKKAKKNVVARFIQYLKDVRSELKRVVWPGREEVVNSSLIVIATLIFFTVFVLVVDQAASFAIIEQLAGIGR